MGLFTSLFGSSTSDAAQKARQDALNAFNAVKTPELSALQVQLTNYVNQGKLTPEQAEVKLISSNAFNDIKTDPSLTGAQKQALTSLQTIGTEGGMTAIDKAQLQDIQNTQNQANRSQNEATMQQAQARGMGTSGINAVNQLINEQGNANRASEQGTQVAANAQTRALQALQAAGQLGGSMEAQQYGEQANKANAGNAIEQFNTQNQNATNMANTNTANNAQAANLANAQNVANANTSTQNANKEYNAQQNQTVYNDQMQKAQGIAGVNQNAANAAQAQKNMETGADMGLVSGIIGGAAKVAAPAMSAFSAAPATSSAVDNTGFATGSVNPYQSYKVNPNAYFSKGGQVSSVDHTTITPKDVSDFQAFLADFRPTKMAKGGEVRMGKKEFKEEHNELLDVLENPTEKKLSNEYDKQSKEMKEKEGYSYGGACMDEGGVAGSTETVHMPTEKPKDEEKNWAEKLVEMIGGKSNVLGSHGEDANNVDKNQGGAIDFRSGGAVPGQAKLPGDSPVNDTVPARLSPGEVVLPRTVVKNPARIPSFVEKSIHPNPNHISSALHSLMNPKKEKI